MKKYISLLVAVLMLITALPTAAFAAHEAAERPFGTMTFTLGHIDDALPGTDVSIPLDIEGPDYEAHSLLIDIHFDPEHISLNSVTNGPVTQNKPSGSMLLYNTNTPGLVSYCLLCPMNGFTGTGNIFTLNLHIDEEFSGLVPLDLNVREFYYYPAGGSKVLIDHIDNDGYISVTEAHTVTFLDWDGSVIEQQFVAHGEAAVPPADPVRTGYTFIGWEGDYSCVTEDITVTALYEINYYTVRFIDIFEGETTELSVQSVPYGGAATAPTPPEHKGYTFIGWDRDFSHVTMDMTIRARYEITTYTVTFLDWDGTVLSVQTVLPGDQAIPPEVPDREGYIFVGWDDDSFFNVTCDLTITAVYEIMRFRVTFYDWDGKTEISHCNVPYGSAAEEPEPPVHDGYTFDHWDQDISCVTTDLDVTAVYRVTTFTVTFVDLDETVLSVQEVVHNEDAVAPEVPHHPGYEFIGWDCDFTNVTCDLVVKALYEITGHIVTFLDWDGETVIGTCVVEDGTAATAPEAPIHEDYVFIGWDGDFSCVTEDISVTAIYALLGDVNFDGVVDTTDALLTLRAALLIITFDDEQMLRGDFNRSGSVDTADALLILRRALNIE